MLLTSPLLDQIPGLRHGFSTRHGGISEGPYGTLNLGFDVDTRANVVENRRRFAGGIGLDGDTIVQVNQVHGTAVIDGADLSAEPTTEADGLIAGRPGLAVGVRTADCAPVLIASLRDEHVHAVAAVHAGWRSATAGILRVALEALGGAPRDLRVAIGPTIGVEHFEVGPEVIAAAQASLGGAPPPTQDGPRGRPHLDLVELLVRQLEGLGLKRAQIDRVGGCTFSSPADFFSHRRDQGVTGRHLSAIYFEDNS